MITFGWEAPNPFSSGPVALLTRCHSEPAFSSPQGGLADAVFARLCDERRGLHLTLAERLREKMNGFVQSVAAVRVLLGCGKDCRCSVFRRAIPRNSACVA